MTNYLTYEDVLRLETESLILIDSGAEAREISGWYKQEVYEKKTFAQMDHSYLQVVLENLTRFLNLVALPQIFTTSRVVAEIARFKEKIHEKLENLIRRENSNYKTHIKKHEEHENYTRELFEDIMLTYKEIHRLAGKSTFAPSDVKFDNLVKVMSTVADNTFNIKDYGLRHEDEHMRRSDDLRADDELVAAALYSSFDKKPSAIMTGDSDLIILLENAVRFLGNQDMQRHTHVLSALRNHPVHIYFVSAEGLKCETDSAQIETARFFNIPNKKGSELATVKGDFDHCLKLFFPSTEPNLVPKY